MKVLFKKHEKGLCSFHNKTGGIGHFPKGSKDVSHLSKDNVGKLFVSANKVYIYTPPPPFSKKAGRETINWKENVLFTSHVNWTISEDFDILELKKYLYLVQM